MRLDKYIEGKAVEPAKPGVSPDPGPPLKVSPKSKSLKLNVDPVEIDQDKFKKDQTYRSRTLKAIGRQLKKATRGLKKSVSDVAKDELSEVAVIIFENVMESKELPESERKDLAKNTTEAVVHHYINAFLERIKIPRPIAKWLSKTLTRLLFATFNALIEKWMSKPLPKKMEQLSLPGMATAAAKKEVKEFVFDELSDMVDEALEKAIDLLSKGKLPTTMASAFEIVKASMEPPMKLSTFLKTAAAIDPEVKKALMAYQAAGVNSGAAKKSLIPILKRAVQGGDLFQLHPGPMTLYRGHKGKSKAPKGVSSWTCSRAVAEMFGDNIIKITINQDTPAIEVSKVPGLNRGFATEREIIVLL